MKNWPQDVDINHLRRRAKYSLADIILPIFVGLRKVKIQ